MTGWPSALGQAAETYRSQSNPNHSPHKQEADNDGKWALPTGPPPNNSTLGTRFNRQTFEGHSRSRR